MVIFWAFCAFMAWMMVGGAVTGVVNGFLPPNQRASRASEAGFVFNVVAWPITLLIWTGWLSCKAAEATAEVALKQVQLARGVTVALNSGQTVEGEYEQQAGPKGSVGTALKSTR